MEDGATEEFIYNHAPQFDDPPPTFEIAENTVSDQPVGEVTASDPDNTTENPGTDTLTYSLDTEDGASFRIDAEGQIRTKDALDFEAKRTYNVAVFVRDNKDIYGEPDTVDDNSIDVIINVKDVNEPPDPPAAPTVTPKSGTTDSLDVTWAAPDTTGKPDITGYELQYQVEGTDPVDWSTVNVTVTGATAVISGLESYTNYEVQVKASNDEGSSDWSESGEGRTNNTPPTFNDDDGSGTTTRFLPENTAAGESVGLPVEATDDGSSLTYTLEGTDVDSFTIVSTSGQIQTKQGVSYDHEDKPSYSVTVKAEDDEGSTATIEVTIEITDVDEPPPPPAAPTVTPKSGTTDSLDVTWDAPDTAGKPDITSYELQYQVKGTDPAAWSTPTATGTDPSHTITGLDSGTTYEVQVKASNDEGTSGWSDSGDGSTDNTAPTFTETIPQGENSLARSVPENSVAGENVGAPVSASDDDGDNLTYTLEGTDADSFTIVSTTGQIQTKEGVSYDHETQETYSVVVKADDEKGGTDTIAVTITVTDVDEDGSITFSADPPSAGTALTATLNDDDTPISGETWKWQISDDGQSNWRIITGADANSYIPKEAEIGKFLRITVEYTDSFGGNKSATADTAAIDSAPTTNEHPAFADSTTTREVAENAPAGQNIGDPVAATHADSVGTLVYSLDANGASNFDVDSSTGQLKTKTVFDYEIDGHKLHLDCVGQRWHGQLQQRGHRGGQQHRQSLSP